jgi:hypothetical protein
LIIGYSCQPTSHGDRPRKSLATFIPSEQGGYGGNLALCYAFEFASMITVWIVSFGVVSVSF